MKAIIILSFSICLLFNGLLKGQNVNKLHIDDEIQKEITLIKVSDYIIDQYGDSIWKNISKTPLRILLITDSLEYLFNHNNPDKSFELFKYDSLLKTNIYVRSRRFPPFLRATFPAVNGEDCIVVGDPENTNKSNEDWIIMLLHEHFHLYQGSIPLYKKNIAELAQKIANNSENWMLDYDFPYADTTINNLFKKYSSSIYETHSHLCKENIKDKMDYNLIIQKEIQNYLTPNDYSYFQFQIWQEGIATYTEYKYLYALNLIDKYFEKNYALNFTLKHEDLLKAYSKNLLNADLQKNKRNLFYSIGLLKGIIKDETNPDWKTDYFRILSIE